jgi:nicotinate-nucleotide adenylyltransferase
VPAATQPFKQGRHRASAEHRLAMLRLAAAADPRFVVDDREVRRGGVSYTVDTLRELRAEYPDDSLSLLVGADAAADLVHWYEAAALPSLAHIVVLTRPGASVPATSLPSRTLEVPAVDVSATEVRERVRRGAPIAELVPAAVAEYIARHGLYRD